MKILYLYTEAMGYTLATIKALIATGAEVHLVFHDHTKQTPYQLPNIPHISIYKRSQMSDADLFRLATELHPDITQVSGWVDKGYLAVAKQLRSRGAIVVTGLDNQWQGTLRQYGAVLLSRFGYLARYFSHVWVAGAYQYELARRLGFSQKQIVFDLYCADLILFHAAYTRSYASKHRHYPHRFLFVGRFAAVKGLDILIRAWQSLNGVRGDWELYLIGSGPLRDTLPAIAGVVIKDFMQPEQLIAEVAEAGCFVLPSRSEPWGVVVHEFCAAGLPMILSDVVGAASSFLIPGLNGFHFQSGDAAALAARMRQIMATSEKGLIDMATASHQLSHRISPETSAHNLLSTFNG